MQYIWHITLLLVLLGPFDSALQTVTASSSHPIPPSRASCLHKQKSLVNFNATYSRSPLHQYCLNFPSARGLMFSLTLYLHIQQQMVFGNNMKQEPCQPQRFDKILFQHLGLCLGLVYLEAKLVCAICLDLGNGILPGRSA